MARLAFLAACWAVFAAMMTVVGLILRPITDWTARAYGWQGAAIMFAAIIGTGAFAYLRNRRLGRLPWQVREREEAERAATARPLN